MISRGHVLYQDYFSHHMPLPYYVAAVASRAGISGIEGYRVFTSAMILIFWSFIVSRFRTSLPSMVRLMLILTIAVAHPIFSGHMLLAETIASYCILIMLLYFYSTQSLSFRISDQVVLSLLITGALLSTLMAVYPLLVMALFYVFQRARSLASSRDWSILKHDARLCALILSALLFTLAVFATNGMFGPWIDGAITFNREHYAKFALAGDPAIVLRRILSGYYRHVLSLQDIQVLGSTAGLLVLADLAVLPVLVRQRGVAFALSTMLSSWYHAGVGRHSTIKPTISCPFSACP